MVKIINQTGEIKTGKQGGSCYQRHYGIQMRRVIQPKKGFTSQTQAEQRRLFIDGLAFRKSLSRANKIYLDGFCIAHRLVDTLGVPLTWDRFVMRIALEKPRVTLL